MPSKPPNKDDTSHERCGESTRYDRSLLKKGPYKSKFLHRRLLCGPTHCTVSRLATGIGDEATSGPCAPRVLAQWPKGRIMHGAWGRGSRGEGEREPVTAH